MLGLHKDKFVNIGKNETPEKVLKILRRKDNGLREVTSHQAADVEKGIVAAFQEGRPENLRVIAVDERYVRLHAAKALETIFKQSGDAPGDIALLVDGLSEKEKKTLLDNALKASVYADVDASVTAALFAAGAVMKAEDQGYLMLHAVVCGSQDTVKLLHDHGCEFDSVIVEMLGHGYDSGAIEKARIYEKKFGKAPAAAPAEAADAGSTTLTNETLARMLETQQQMAEQIRELTEVVKRLQPAAEAPADKPASRPFSGKPYPHT